MLTINNTLDGYLKDVEIKGNTIQDAENLADIRSVGDTVEGQELYEIPVVTRGKNLFDISKLINEKKIDDIGNMVNGLSNESCIFIKVPSVKLKYSISKVGNVLNPLNGTRLFAYDKNLKLTRVIGWIAGNNGNIELNSNETYIGLSFMYSDDTGTSLDCVKTIQLEEGTVATPYEPYQEDKLTILSPTPLEKVGDVADRLVCKDGVWGVEKNVTQKLDLLKATWIRHVENDNNLVCKTSTYSDVVFKEYGDKIISNFTASIPQAWNGQTVGISTFNDGWIYLCVPKNLVPTIDNLSTYLNNVGAYAICRNSQPQFIPLPHDQQVKLRTFANKTNISFLTEIEGTIKAQVPKSLGATVNTHTEQIRSLNNELNRVKKLEESTVSTVTTESDFTTVEATSNGYFEDVKLEGKTLVNLWDINSIGKSGETVVENNRVTVTTTSNIYSNFFYEQKSKFKPSTEYTIVVDIYKNTLQSSDKIYITSNSGASSDNRDIFASNGSTQFIITGGVIGRIVKRYTTISDFNEADFALRSFVSNESQTEGGELELNITVLEGDHTQNPPSGYIEGLKSVGQSATTSEDGTDEIVVSSVKEKVQFEQGTLANANGEPIDNANRIRSIDFINGKDFEIGNVDLTRFYVLFMGYDENKTYIYSSGWCKDTKPPTEYPYVKVVLKINDNTPITPDILKSPVYVVGRNTDKKRLLYYNNETQTWEKPILREWDSIEKHADGKYYYHQRSGEVVLNGSEDWVVDTVGGEDTTVLYSSSVYAKPRSVCISDKLNYFSNDTWNSVSGDYIKVGGSGKFDVSILKSKLSTQDVQGFKQWLQANNVTVVYQLAQEKVYECTNIDLITYANETNYVVESGVLSPRTTLKVHNNISNVVSLLQKKVSLLESNMTKYMITQNRLMLASRYNADTVSFKVDVATLRNSFEYDNDLYELILNNILVGKDNYNREYIENLIIFYWMDFVISDEMYSTLFEIIEEQHNPKIEEETPLI